MSTNLAATSIRAEEEKMPLEIEPQHIFVSGQISGEGQPPIHGRFMVDTGSSMVATLTKRFTDDHKLLPPRDQLSTLPVCGLAGMMTTKSLVGNVGALQLGTLKFITRSSNSAKLVIMISMVISAAHYLEGTKLFSIIHAA
jgi:hypothetical protein